MHRRRPRLRLRGLPRLDTRLQIQPLRSNVLYRVDASLPRGQAIDWGSRTMLQATGLPLRELGLLALGATGAEPPVLAPVAIGDEAAADTGRKAYAVLRPSVAVSTLAWRSHRRSQPQAAPSPWQELPGSRLFAWERIALPIELPADDLALTVEVRALDGQGQALPLLRFIVLGTGDDKP